VLWLAAIFLSVKSPVWQPWIWTLVFGYHGDRTPDARVRGDARGCDGGIRQELATAIDPRCRGLPSAPINKLVGRHSWGQGVPRRIDGHSRSDRPNDDGCSVGGRLLALDATADSAEHKAGFEKGSPTYRLPSGR
jgi:hypothetical protein